MYFFRKTKCSIFWKLKVYNAVIISRLLYGLESLEFIKALEHRLDTFQMKGLRAILKIEHSYWSRISNEKIYAKVNYLLDTKHAMKGKESIQDFGSRIEDILNASEEEEREWLRILQEGRLNDTNHFKPISEILKERKAKLLGHILRGCNRENESEDFGERREES